MQDPDRKEFDAISFDPQYKNKNDFNLFTGFKLDNKPNPNVDTKPIHNLLNHLL